MRLGAYQLLYLHTPPHAAVGETVDLAGPRERGFVNAVLRKLATDPPAWPSGTEDRDVAVTAATKRAEGHRDGPPPLAAALG